MKKLLPVLVLSAMFGACENPMSTMGEMKETTGDMSKTTEGMSRTTQDMKMITENMYVSLRQQASEETRRNKWNSLMSENTDMADAVADAKILYMAFEFQVWYGKAAGHGLHERETLVLHALEEIFMRASAKHQALVANNRINQMSPLELAGKDKNLERYFYALAAGMDFRNEFQKKLIAENAKIGIQTEEISVLDVVKNALLKEKNGEYMSPAESHVTLATNRRLAVDLLEARMNIGAALALKEVVNTANMGLREKINGLAFNITSGRYGALQVDHNFPQASDETRRVVLLRLAGAVEAKELLKEIGETPRLQKDIQSILSNLDIQTDADANAAQAAGNVPKNQSDSEKLQELRQKLLSDE